MSKEFDRGASGRMVGMRSIKTGLALELGGVLFREPKTLLLGVVGIVGGIVIREHHVRKMRRQSGESPDKNKPQ